MRQQLWVGITKARFLDRNDRRSCIKVWKDNPSRLLLIFFLIIQVRPISDSPYIHSKLFHKLTGCKQSETIFLNEHHGSHICNPDFNNEDCRFDGGDCCLPIIDDKYCPPRPSTACNCHEDNSRHTSFTEGMQLIYRTPAILTRGL